MDSTQLAQAMLEYGKLMKEASALEKEIEAAVLEIGKTQTVGNVRATFSNPRKTYQGWDEAVMEAEPEGLDIEDYIQVVTTTTIAWQQAAADFGIERKSWILEGATPSVKVKLV